VKIFTGVAPDNHYDTIRDAVVSIVRHAQSLSLTKTPWSFVELFPDEEDFAWLCEWAQHLAPGIAFQCLNNGQWKRFRTEVGNFSYSTGIGILLLMFAVEVARRNASERSLWSTISHSYFSVDTQKVLFAQNYPTRAYKDTIELAARWLNLRHVFGVANLQNWYDTIYLQLGFTERGFTSRLPEWLAGYNSTFAIQQLLDGSMKSTTFIDLWTALGWFRRSNISEVQLRRKLQNNPWILPEWIPELIQQAKAKLQLPDVANTNNISLLSSDESSTQFLSTPRLFWNAPQEPTFLCRIMNLTRLELTEPTYSIIVADRIRGSLHRNTDGTYRPHPSDEIVLPATTSLLVASLVAPDGSIVQNQTLQLWDEGEDVSVFEFTTGVGLNAWTSVLKRQKSYYLILAADLEIQPPLTHWHVLNTHTRLHILEKDWSPQIQILLEGCLLWEPKTSFASSSQKQLDEKAIEIHLYDTPVPLSFNQPIRIEISHPQNYTIVFIRSVGQPINFNRHTPRLTVTEAIPIQPHMLSLKAGTDIELTLGIQLENSRMVMRLRSRVKIPLIGVTLLGKDGWVALDVTQPLNVEQANRQLMRFYLIDNENWPLLEGDTWIDTTWKTPKTLQKCAGFGAPLKIQKSAYNATAFDPPRQIVREVINTGCVETITITENLSTRVLQIQLTHLIEPDTFHAIVWWDQDGSYTLFPPEHWETRDDGMYWSSPLPLQCSQPLAIAIAYDGTWLGTWSSKNWSGILNASTAEVSTLSALMRWFHLPLLGLDVSYKVERFSYANASVTLPIWLDEQCPLPDLQFTSSDEGWLSVVRRIFVNWQPGSSINDLVQHLSDPSFPDPLSVTTQMVWKLSRVSPILMAKVLQSWIEKVCIPQWGRPQSKALIHQLLYEIADVHDKSSLAKRENDLLQEIATIVMKVDTNFIQRALLARASSSIQGQQISAIDQENIAIAIQIEPFRRLLSIHLLEHIYGQLEGNRSKK
jgi:hypothetical protein